MYTYCESDKTKIEQKYIKNTHKNIIKKIIKKNIKKKK